MCTPKLRTMQTLHFSSYLATMSYNSNPDDRKWFCLNPFPFSLRLSKNNQNASLLSQYACCCF